jgi:hypothetical protein
MITPHQCRAARGMLAWTQDRLSAAAGVSLSAIKDFEAERRQPMPANRAAIQRAFEAAGVEFTNGDEPGLKLKKPKR